MPAKLCLQDVKSYIDSKGDVLVSKNYDNNKSILDITCGTCKNNYNQTFDRFRRGFQHKHCNTIQFGGYKKPFTLKPITCIVCMKEFQPVKSISKLCSLDCAHILSRTDKYIHIASESGKIGGKISATRQCRRSKNEIYFSQLCARDFVITTNEPFFDGWDADVIIHSEKTAILWNGIWHYKPVIKTRSLKQAQLRDKIKMDVIEKYGYIPYVIKDMGGYNRAFVEQEYEIFKLMRMYV
jgi:hypothetical protein